MVTKWRSQNMNPGLPAKPVLQKDMAQEVLNYSGDRNGELGELT